MSVHRHRATWRSITFNTHYLDDGTMNPDNPANLVEANVHNDYYLDELQINRVSVQDYRELRQFLEGAEPNEAFEGVRALTGSGRIQAPDYATLEDKAWALNEAFSIAACRIAAQSLDPKGVLPFDFARDTLPLIGAGGDVPTKKLLRFYARPGPARPVWVGRKEGGLVRPFSFQLIAFDPLAYDQVETQDTVTLGGDTVTNPGNLYTKPKITVVMSGNGHAGFQIQHNTTGQILQLDLSSFGAGTIVVDVAKSTITKLADGSNQYSRRTFGFVSSMFLLPGANTVTMVNTTNVTSVTYNFRGAYA